MSGNDWFEVECIRAQLSPHGKSWYDALVDLDVRHPNRISRVRVKLDDQSSPQMTVSLDQTFDTNDLAEWHYRRPFVIACTQLMFWPGKLLAQRWFAAAWAGYAQHEALELVRVKSVPVLNPHDQPYPTNPWNRGLRDGFPTKLTPSSMRLALATVMAYDEAARIVERFGEYDGMHKGS